MSVILFLFTAYGVCFGLMNDKAPIIPAIRNLPILPDKNGKTFFSRMLACPYCTGFHAGWIAWIILRLQRHLMDETDVSMMIGDALAHAFAASAFCYLADTVAQWVEQSNE
jgi:hypothetical protein